MHPTESTWRELLDGEVVPLVRRELERHLTVCEDCEHDTLALQRDKAAVAALLQALDGPVPTPDLEAVLHRARRRISRRWTLIAAAIGLFVVTAAGATIRNGAFHHLLDRFRNPKPAPVKVDRPTLPATPDTARAPTRIAFEARGDVEIAFQEAQDRGQLSIDLGDESTVAIVASAAVPYAIKAGRVTVANREVSASYIITLPKTVPHATIRIADRIVFTKTGSVIMTAAVKDSSGRYLLLLTRNQRTDR